jgi:hypothetical protein
MAEKSKVKITVAKKLDARDIFGNQMPETSDAFQGPICTLWEEGKKFIVQEDGRMPRISAAGPGMISTGTCLSSDSGEISPG